MMSTPDIIKIVLDITALVLFPAAGALVKRASKNWDKRFEDIGTSLKNIDQKLDGNIARTLELEKTVAVLQDRVGARRGPARRK